MNHKEGVYDKERIHLNLARIRKSGKVFELVVDPDLAIAYKSKLNKTDDDLRNLLKAEKVFYDAKKGDIAAEAELKKIFGTDDIIAVAKLILDSGEIQFTSEHREKLREEKRKKIVNIIHRSAVDPKTGFPHPITRIESAMNEAKVKIDEYKKAEDQVQDVLNMLKPIIPIKFDEKVLSIKLPLQYAAKLHSTLPAYGKIENENWLSDGSYMCKLIIPAGMISEIMDELNKRTHGSVLIEFVKT